VNGGPWGKERGVYKPVGERARRAGACSSLKIGTDHTALAVASRLVALLRPTAERRQSKDRSLMVFHNNVLGLFSQQTEWETPCLRNRTHAVHPRLLAAHARACTPPPITLPGECMHGLRQWSANGPERETNVHSHVWTSLLSNVPPCCPNAFRDTLPSDASIHIGLTVRRRPPEPPKDSRRPSRYFAFIPAARISLGNIHIGGPYAHVG